MERLQRIIDAAWEERTTLTPAAAHTEAGAAVEEAVALLDSGRLRVAEKIEGRWVTHQWVKKAVLLSFRLQDNFVLKDGYTQYYDKVPPKFADLSADALQRGGVRVVPPAAARKGAYIARNVVLMPSFVNIG